MANLRTDSPLSRRIACSFIQFLNSVEPSPGVDGEAIDVAKECLAEAFKIDQASLDTLSGFDSLVDIFTAREAIAGHDERVSDAPSSSLGKSSQSTEDDEVHFNGPVPVLPPEKIGTVEDPLTNKKHAPAEVPKLGKTAIPASEDASVTPPQPVVVPFSSAPAFEKPVESTNPSLLTFSSKSVEKSPSLPTEYGTKAEPKVESSSSLVDVSVSAGLEGKISESDKSGHVNLQARDTNDRSDTDPHAKGPHVSTSSPVSIDAAASDGTTEASEGSIIAITSTSISTVNSTNTALSESVFGAAGNPSNLAGPLFKFGSPADPAVLVPKISEISDTRTELDINPSSDSSSVLNSSGVAPDAAKPESNGSELGSSVSQPTVNLQGSLLGIASKPIIFGTGTVSQGTTLLPDFFASAAGTTSQGMSVLSVSSAPSLFSDIKMNSSGALSNPQVISPSSTFGFSSASSSDTNTTALPGSEAGSSVFRFGASPISEGTGVTFSSASTPGIFSFGLNSSFSSSAAGANSSSSLPKFNFVGSSLASASVSSTASSFSSGTSGIFNFGGSSTSSGVPSLNRNTGANVLSSSVESFAPSIFGSSFASASPSTGFAFGASSSSSSSTSFTPIRNTSSVMPFNSSAGASSSPLFSFTSGSISASSSQSLPSNNNNNTQPVFGNLSASGFTPSSGNNDQMNAEDSMAEDPVQSSSTPPAAGVFGQSLSTPPAAGVFGQSSSVTPGGFTFGSTVPAQPQQPFMFGNQQNQAPMQTPSRFQASSSLDFNGGSSFSLGSGGGGDKSGRRIVKINRSKNRKR